MASKWRESNRKWPLNDIKGLENDLKMTFKQLFVKQTGKLHKNDENPTENDLKMI